MTDNLIASQHLNPKLREVLSALLESMIPSNDEYGVPSAGEDVVVEDFVRSMRGTTIELITNLLLAIDEESASQFVSWSMKDRLNLFENMAGEHRHGTRVLGSLLLQVYYRNDQVLESLGMEARAPFPLGHEVERGDYSLLDQVKARGEIYRAV